LSGRKQCESGLARFGHFQFQPTVAVFLMPLGSLPVGNAANSHGQQPPEYPHASVHVLFDEARAIMDGTSLKPGGNGVNDTFCNESTAFPQVLGRRCNLQAEQQNMS
jgi:hypothetical protein